ncbi:hypothetical protein JBL43_16455 [Aureibaculum sp. A20]|uniref:Lipoprotein n=1 Tax=Aureibaculum flavum TaxID=2795986 RepID=A0ABS0WV20_9FLAO|nr:hypothetical protein [Aureibaculum flavum]MBJ2175847.1 hypothetical protein [Aureibaculum flavum]
MKKINLIAILLLIVSCGKPLENVYERKNEKEDLQKIKKILDEDGYWLLNGQIEFMKSTDREKLNEQTYSDILLHAKIRWNDTLAQREVDKIEREKKILEQENETKNHQLNLICDIKWGIYYRKPEYLEINTEISESDQKLARTAFEWDPKTNWIIFNRDGTCKIKDSETDKILSKNWSLDEKGIVFPTGWTKERFSNKVIFEILNLDNDEFNVTELDISPNITLRNEVKMKRINL